MAKPNKILILHGWEADPQSNWFLDAKNFFQNKGYEVFAPYLPGNYYPRLAEWLRIIKQYHPDEEWILIGHSLGGVAILRFLEQATEMIAQAILTAAPIEPMQFTPIANFFPPEFDYQAIKKNTSKINLIYEADDQMVPLEQGKILSRKLNAPLEIVPGALHLHKLDLRILEKLIDG